jgi:excisionase family DNA binding protein
MWLSYSGNKMLRKQQRLLQRPDLRPWRKRAGNPGEKRPETTSLRDYITAQEAAEYLRISTATVYKLLRTGRLNGVKTKRDWRVSRGAVLALGDDRSRSASQLGRRHGSF